MTAFSRSRSRDTLKRFITLFQEGFCSSKLDVRVVRGTSMDANDDATNVRSCNFNKQDNFLSVRVVITTLAQIY